MYLPHRTLLSMIAAVATPPDTETLAEPGAVSNPIPQMALAESDYLLENPDVTHGIRSLRAKLKFATERFNLEASAKSRARTARYSPGSQRG